MAARFWVGGTGTWDSTTTANWSATSGGAGGASVPGAADDVTINTASITVTTNYNVSVISVTINASAATLSLGGTLTCSGVVTLTQGTLTTNNFNVTATSLSSSNSNTRTINLGSSTVTLSGTGTVINFVTNTGLTFNAGTSSIVLTNVSPSISVSGQTFYDVVWSSTAITTASVANGSATFNNLTVTGRSTAGVSIFQFVAPCTINGTLTLSAGTNATMRTFVRSETIGTTRTLTCAAVASLTDVDFRDITIAGAAAPVSGTRLGDCKGNSGITFPAAKTVYWRSTASANWGATTWSFTNGGTADVTAFPLAQDTAVFPSSPTPYPTSGNSATVNAAYNIGTIDMSARTSNTMTLATGSNTPQIYGNWINGTGTTLTGTGVLTFAGRGSQTITSAGRAFTQPLTINTPGGSVALQDALNLTGNNIVLTFGVLDAVAYNVTFGSLTNTSLSTRTLGIGSGTWTVLNSTSPWTTNSTNLTVTGTGTISLTSASAKTFAGGGIQTYPTLNQGGTGTLTVTGSNKFANITDTAIGRVQFTNGTTNIFDAFNLSGVAGNLLQLGSTTTAQATLQKSSAWLMGANSTDAGNNTGLSFTAGGGIDYLSVSYINGTVVAPFISASILESATANSTESSLGTFSPTVSELATGSDVAASSVVFLGTLSESATAADLAAAGIAYLRSISESATAAEINSVIETILAVIRESASAQDLSAVVASAFSAAAAEIAAARDTAQAAATFPTALSESAQVSESNASAFTAATSVSEAATASETSSSLAVFGGAIAELAIGLDAALVVASVFSATAAEIAQARDLLDAPGSVYNAAMSEIATASDRIVGAYLWNPIDDTQVPNWQNINNAQSVTWTTVPDTQNPGWTIIPTSND